MIYIVLFFAILGTFEIIMSLLKNITKSLIIYIKDLTGETLGAKKYYPAILSLITAGLWVWFYYLSH